MVCVAVAPIHLRPTAELAERALLPGDPGRALALAQALLAQPRMFNHHRGLWGYTGTAADGEPLTVQSTGMGGPSAAIVLEELAMLGLRRAVRVGTCGALSAELALGDLVIATEAVTHDGSSRALGSGARVLADAALLAALTGAARDSLHRRPVHHGPIVTTDLFYDPRVDQHQRWSSEGALAVEMEAAALFAVGRRRGVAIGCLLTVSDVFTRDGQRSRIDDDPLLQAAEAMGALAVAALRA